MSIFLRLLEYHQGILFLTTNRGKNLWKMYLNIQSTMLKIFFIFSTVKCFDAAFKSRISVALKYNDLDEDGKLPFIVAKMMFLNLIMTFCIYSTWTSMAYIFGSRWRKGSKPGEHWKFEKETSKWKGNQDGRKISKGKYIWECMLI